MTSDRELVEELVGALTRVRDWDAQIEAMPFGLAMSVKEALSKAQQKGLGAAQSQPGSDECSQSSLAAGEISASMERNSADYAVEFGGYLATTTERFLDFLNETSAFADCGFTTAQYEAASDMRGALRSDIYEFTKRAKRYKAERASPSLAADSLSAPVEG